MTDQLDFAMKSMNSSQGVATHLTDTVQAISDLETLVHGLKASLPQGRQWQRRLREHVLEVDRLLDILRLTIAMDREAIEVRQASADLLEGLRTASRFADVSRADKGAKIALQLGLALAKKIVAGLLIPTPS